jgi:hypothetical protein
MLHLEHLCGPFDIRKSTSTKFCVQGGVCTSGKALGFHSRFEATYLAHGLRGQSTVGPTHVIHHGDEFRT